ncbi:DUF1153 domain-containing protein [Falsirhodobacter algicola]|uniref:DUF1153 domain-containing protein n=1 Tax=Falsirhodobacter algicola TaxID=2692330 RepID=A0A8J8SK26_9RHOB|nr:DUF1153 domain-containing protein [Falsirhodobacter algicola]QUS35440.1 DUF1153 domain-containing protein [Falsirhodobacter algicola]
MYLRKSSGPRHVRLPDGSLLTRADLPPADTRRWVASRKAIVVRAVAHGLITADDAITIYSLSEEELQGWMRSLSIHGEQALKVTALRRFR